MSSSASSTIADRISQAEELKKAGNGYFQKGKYRKARVKYSTVFAYIKGLGAGGSEQGMAQYASALRLDRPTPDEEQTIRALSVSCSSNIALCYFKLKEYEPCIEHSDRVLAIDPDHVKSLYRKGAALSRLDRDLETARGCLRKAVDLDPGKNSAAAAKELTRVRRKLRDQEAKSDKKLAKALRGAL